MWCRSDISDLWKLYRYTRATECNLLFVFGGDYVSGPNRDARRGLIEKEQRGETQRGVMEWTLRLKKKD